MGANAGRVIDRVTGEAAPAMDDDTRSIEDRVDLAQERVKQAQQEVANVETLMKLKKMDLEAGTTVHSFHSFLTCRSVFSFFHSFIRRVDSRGARLDD